MERLVCLIFKVFSLLFSNFKSLWTTVSCCVQKAYRRVHYTFIGRYEHLIGRYGRIATRYVHNTAHYAYIGRRYGQRASCDVQFMSYVQQKVVTGRFHAVLYRWQVVIPYCSSLLKVYFIHNDF